MNADVCLRLDIFDSGDELVFIVDQPEVGRQQAARWFERHDVDRAALVRLRDDIAQLIGIANDVGTLDRLGLAELKRLGALLFDDVFPPNLKRLLRNTTIDHLLLRLPDSLLPLPWELLHDGGDFLTLRWAMGREILRRGSGASVRCRPLPEAPNLLIVADAAGDLPEAYNEGVALRELLDDSNRFAVSFRSSRVNRLSLREELREFDVVHFAGHVRAEGLQLCDGVLSGTDLIGLAGGLPMPALLFVNGCESATSGVHLHAELARSALEAGVRHYLGALYELPDHLSRDFAIAFYRELTQGATVGVSLRGARQELLKKHGLASVLWVPYVLYGDPEVRICGDRAVETDPASGPPSEPRAATFVNSAGSQSFTAKNYIKPRPARRPALRGTAIRTDLGARSRQLQRAVLQAFAVSVLLLALGVAGFVWFFGAAQTPAPQTFRSPPLATQAPAGLAPMAPPSSQHLSLLVMAEEATRDGFYRVRELHDGDTIRGPESLRVSMWSSQPGFVYLFRVAGTHISLVQPVDPEWPHWQDVRQHELVLLPANLEGRENAGQFEALVLAVRTDPLTEVPRTLLYLNDLLSSIGSSPEPESEVSRMLSTQGAVRLLVEQLEGAEAQVRSVTLRRE